MQLLKKLSIGLIGIILLFLIIGWMLPSEFRVERSIKINAPADKIYPYLVNLRQWQKWGVWFKRDPNMVIEYEGPDSAIGMKSSWKSETQGNGEMTITDLMHNEKVVYDLYFPDFEMGSTGQLTLRASEGGTEVVWLDYGDVGGNPVDHYFAAMMDSMIGPDFESGLDNLKMVVENTN